METAGKKISLMSLRRERHKASHTYKILLLQPIIKKNSLHKSSFGLPVELISWFFLPSGADILLDMTIKQQLRLQSWLWFYQELSIINPMPQCRIVLFAHYLEIISTDFIICQIHIPPFIQELIVPRILFSPIFPHYNLCGQMD